METKAWEEAESCQDGFSQKERVPLRNENDLGRDNSARPRFGIRSTEPTSSIGSITAPETGLRTGGLVSENPSKETSASSLGFADIQKTVRRAPRKPSIDNAILGEKSLNPLRATANLRISLAGVRYLKPISVNRRHALQIVEVHRRPAQGAIDTPARPTRGLSYPSTPPIDSPVFVQSKTNPIPSKNVCLPYSEHPPKSRESGPTPFHPTTPAFYPSHPSRSALS